MNIPLIYGIIFFLSFTVLSLQVTLAILLTAIAFPPFLAVSFAFLGLSIASVYVYIKYSRHDVAVPESVVVKTVFHLAILLLFSPVAMKILFLFQRDYNGGGVANAGWQGLLAEVMRSSILTGLIFSLLFFFMGKLYALIYKYYSGKAPTLYFFDLTGAALGCIFPIIILNFLQLSSIFLVLSFFAFFVAARLVMLSRGGRPAKIYSGICLLACLIVLCFNIKTDVLEVDMRIRGMGVNPWRDKNVYRELWHRWNAYSRVALVNIQQPGQKYSTNAFSLVNGTAWLIKYNPEYPVETNLFKEYRSPTLGFLLGTPRDMLVLMAGAGADMVVADNYSRGKTDITGVELNPLIVEKAQKLPGYNLRAFFAKENIHMVVAEGRSYVESIDKKFDSILISYAGATAMQYLGIDSYTAQFLYTKEAFKSYLQHLKPDGTITVLGMNKLKVAAAVKAAFGELGEHNVANKIVVIDSRYNIQRNNYQTSFVDSYSGMHLMVKKSDFTVDEITLMGEKLQSIGMDWMYTPSYTHQSLTYFKELLKCDDLNLFLKKLGERTQRDIRLVTDDTPFMTNLFMANSVFSINFWRDILSKSWLKKSGLYGRQASANVFIIAFLALLILLGVVFVILPLLLKANISFAEHFHVLGYFALIGMGFTFVEVVCMHAFTLLLGNPVYSFSIVLLSLLLFTGVGSLLSERLFARGYLNIPRLSLITFVVFLLSYLFIAKIIHLLLPLSFGIRLCVTLALMAPVGCCLGMFFPQGLKRIYSSEKNLIPWVWGINGYMSIIGSALSVFLCRAIGFSALLLIAAFLYLLIFFFSNPGKKL